MNLRDILNEVLAQSAHIKKANFANSSDVDDVQMVSIANRLVFEVRNFYPWGDLRKEFSISVIGGVSNYPMPSDFDTMVPDSGWETEGSRPIEVPVPDGRWYRYKNSAFTDSTTIRCRFYGNELQIADPVDGDKFTFEYMSKFTVMETGGTLREKFVSDTDIYLLDPDVLILGIQSHWAHTKGLPQTEQWRANYLSKLGQLIGRQEGGKTIGGAKKMPEPSPYTPLWVA